MKKIVKIFSYIVGKMEKYMPANDKLSHHFIGYFVAITTSFFVMYFLNGHLKILIPIAGISAGIAKELWDKLHKKTKFDIADVIFTADASIALYFLLQI